MWKYVIDELFWNLNFECCCYSVMSNSLWPHGLCSPPGSSVYGILKARILDWDAISFSRGSSWPRAWTHTSCVSCTGRQILYHLCHLEAHKMNHSYIYQRGWSRKASCRNNVQCLIFIKFREVKTERHAADLKIHMSLNYKEN